MIFYVYGAVFFCSGMLRFQVESIIVLKSKTSRVVEKVGIACLMVGDVFVIKDS